jgi:triacylglycerol lipase
MIKPVHDTPLLPGTLQNLFYPPGKGQYTYFKRAQEVPFLDPEGASSSETLIGARSIAKAAWAADASMLSYARYGQARMTDDDLRDNFRNGRLDIQTIGENEDDWNAPGTQAVFAMGVKFAILAFRGTERDDPQDMISDADIVLWPEPDYRLNEKDPAPVLGHLSFVTHLFEPPCLVHGGFQKALNRVWQKIHSAVMEYRDQNPDAEICFTGHSLGGALAVLAFSRFTDKNISLYTFGCPRVGDAAFRDRVLSNPGRGIFRYVNFNDAVAHVPLESLLYRQTPDACHRLDQEGDLGDDDGSFKGDISSLQVVLTNLPSGIMVDDLDKIAAPPSVVDHSPARYCIRLWNCVP